MVTVFSRVFFLVSILVISKVWETNSVFSKSKLVKYRILKNFPKISKISKFVLDQVAKIHQQKKKNPSHYSCLKHIGTHISTYKRIFCKTFEAQQLQ
jgi:hypothetical protein